MTKSSLMPHALRIDICCTIQVQKIKRVAPLKTLTIVLKWKMSWQAGAKREQEIMLSAR